LIFKFKKFSPTLALPGKGSNMQKILENLEESLKNLQDLKDFSEEQSLV